MRDPLVHAYVTGRIIGAWVGIALGVTLIVLGSCMAACQPIVDSPQLRAAFSTRTAVDEGSGDKSLPGMIRITIVGTVVPPLPPVTIEPAVLPRDKESLP